ncbi:MAG: hypothetical protein Fur0026_06760 [Sideroxydans sp.]
MRASHWVAMTLLLVLPLAHAEEPDPTLELIEMLGEMGEVDSDFDIALSEVKETKSVGESHPQEVKDDE